MQQRPRRPSKRALSAQYGLPVQSGALVAFVQPEQPPSEIQLARGDIITKIGDTSVTGVPDIFAAIRQYKIGDTVTVEAYRNDQVGQVGGSRSLAGVKILLIVVAG